jgi:hypothetical protein
MRTLEITTTTISSGVSKGSLKRPQKSGRASIITRTAVCLKVTTIAKMADTPLTGDNMLKHTKTYYLPTLELRFQR